MAWVIRVKSNIKDCSLDMYLVTAIQDSVEVTPDISKAKVYYSEQAAYYDLVTRQGWDCCGFMTYEVEEISQ